MKLSLAPVPYHWPKAELLAFYERVAAWEVDTVYLGETICAKRRPLRPGEWLEVAEMLEEAGKEVVLSTLALIEAGSEISALRRLCENGRFPVEANDMAAVHLLQGKAFVGGPFLNIYNHLTLATLEELGMYRFVMPVELSRDTLADIQGANPGVETEVLAFGPLPLSLSARCFTARAHNLPKDDCRLSCLDHPLGLPLRTQEEAPFLVLNGVQVLSAKTFSLLDEIDTLKELGVDRLRITPGPHTERVIRAFRAALEGMPHEALEALTPFGLCQGYWHGKAGMTRAS